MSQRMLFVNIAWMKQYQGVTKTDKPKNGGSYIAENGTGGEVYNFKPMKGYYYGYITPYGDVNIDGLGASPDEDSIHDVTVVWVSNSARWGTVIVGWYEHATVLRCGIARPFGQKRYTAKAKIKDCRLLTCYPVDERRFRIPRGEGGMGQSNKWYADKPGNAAFRSKVYQYINANGQLKATGKPKKAATHQWQQDVEKRLRVESAAMKATEGYYQSQGYSTARVHLEKYGWDIEARKGKEVIRVEVKGLSGTELAFELTPNEYTQMKKHKGFYHISVVPNALGKKPTPRVFVYSQKIGGWSDDCDMLQCTELTGARFAI